MKQPALNSNAKVMVILSGFFLLLAFVVLILVTVGFDRYAALVEQYISGLNNIPGVKPNHFETIKQNTFCAITFTQDYEVWLDPSSTKKSKKNAYVLKCQFTAPADFSTDTEFVHRIEEYIEKFTFASAKKFSIKKGGKPLPDGNFSLKELEKSKMQ